MKRVFLFTLMCMTIILSGCSNDGKDAENSGNILQRFTQLFSKTTTAVSSTATLKEGTYYIKSAVNSSYVITAVGPAANYNNVLIWQNEGNPNQKWILKNNGDGSISLYTAMNTDYALDLFNRNYRAGENIQLYYKNTTNAQRWRLDRVGDYYVIRNAGITSWVVDLNNSNASNGNNIWLWEYNGSNAQKWIFSYINSNTGTIGGGQSTQQQTPPSRGQEYQTIQVWVPCMTCGGSGRCFKCNGSGVYTYWVGYDQRAMKCPACNGTGVCPTCHGTRGEYRTEFVPK